MRMSPIPHGCLVLKLLQQVEVWTTRARTCCHVKVSRGKAIPVIYRWCWSSDVAVWILLLIVCAVKLLCKFCGDL